MQSSGWTSVAGVLAIALGLAIASCATQKSTILIKDRTLPHKQQTATSTSKEPDNTQAKIQVVFPYLRFGLIHTDREFPRPRFGGEGQGEGA